VHERVVGVLGYTYKSDQVRDKDRMAGFLGKETSKKRLKKTMDSAGSDEERERREKASGESFQQRFFKKYGAKYDRGHFISLRQGGVYDINLFPQRADINRGWTGEWRAMEIECVKNPGSFCFVRPIYPDDESVSAEFRWVPAELEYGIVRDGKATRKRFPNMPDPD